MAETEQSQKTSTEAARSSTLTEEAHGGRTLVYTHRGGHTEVLRTSTLAQEEARHIDRGPAPYTSNQGTDERFSTASPFKFAGKKTPRGRTPLLEVSRAKASHHHASGGRQGARSSALPESEMPDSKIAGQPATVQEEIR